jgi:hypothetical protein
MGSLRGRRPGALGVAAIGLILLACLTFGYALSQQKQADIPTPTTNSTKAVAPSPNTPAGLPSSPPTQIDIPALGVVSALAKTGLNTDGSPAVPVGADVDKASWLTASATPGETGTSVIIGHVDTVRSGPSVFYKLGKLTPGDTISVRREDNRTAIFTVQSLQTYNKDSFPSSTVYGRSSSPVLRLITCAGTWDEAAHSYTQNLVVFASLTSVR